MFEKQAHLMNRKLFTPINQCAIALSFIYISLLTQSCNAENKVKESPKSDRVTEQVSFYCGEIPERETGSPIPATVAYVPQRKANVPIIAWTSEHLAAWNPQRRCETVSPKFQTFYEDGRLNYLSNGESAGYPIICALLDKQEQCSEENQLFQVRPGSKPEDVVLGLKGILDGKSQKPIYQSSGKQIYISVSDFLENAPAVEDF